MVENYITNLQGQELDSLKLSAGYNQIIDQPKHVTNNFRSCIDLIFCTTQSVISTHGVDVSIFDKVIIMLFMVKLTYVYLSQKANIENIKKAISNFDWNKIFENLSVDEK